jgi:hypothetical protein
MKNSSNNLSNHILPNSATLVGVCMMVISIIKGMHVGYGGKIIDKLLAIDSIIFVGSSILSYLSMRISGLYVRLENIADNSFMFGLLIMAVGTVGLAFEIL